MKTTEQSTGYPHELLIKEPLEGSNAVYTIVTTVALSYPAWLQDPMAKDTIYFGCRIQRSEFQTNQDASSLRSSFQSARRCCTGFWGGRTSVVLPITRSLMLQYQLTRPRYAHWGGSDITITRGNQLLSDDIWDLFPSPKCCTWYGNPGQKSMAGEGLCPRVQPALIILLNGHAMSAFVREASFCNTQQSMVR